MAKRIRHRLSNEEATSLGLGVRKSVDKGLPKYTLTNEQYREILTNRNNNTTDANDYKITSSSMSAMYLDGTMMSIEEYCKRYKIPIDDITSYKLVSHTGVPYYNIVGKPQILKEIDLESIIKKHTKDIKPYKQKPYKKGLGFDTLTYSDVHIGMDTDKYKNSMYPIKWNREEALKSCDIMIQKTLDNKQNDMLVVDELGDLLDGFDAKTTRGGHELPQNMTNEEAFDCALEFKIRLFEGLISHYKYVQFNNICNDNHAGSFGYMVNAAFKQIKAGYDITNYRQFINHYFINDVCFVITHGKDDKTLKFGFKPQLDPKTIEKIDQYCKHNGIYNRSKRIIFKKGDSHQTLFNMCGSDDFDYYNYPALSPSSQWVQNNFKKGRTGFVLESFDGIESTIKTIFIN